MSRFLGPDCGCPLGDDLTCPHGSYVWRAAGDEMQEARYLSVHGFGVPHVRTEEEAQELARRGFGEIEVREDKGDKEDA